MTIYTVSTTSDLLKDAAKAVSGDVIQLTAGTYSNNVLSNIKTSGVTITSADPNNQATLTDLSVNNSSGFTFSNLTLTVASTGNAPYQVYGSSNIVLDHLDIHGSLDGNPNDDNNGMLIRSSTNVTVSNSHFHELTTALTHTDDNGILFTGNTFDTIRDDGIDGGGSSNITVSNNVFTNFIHTGSVHPDAIQFWTTYTKAAASNVTITGNVIDRGVGSLIQGIFVADENGSMHYSNLSVTNNVIVGESYNSIAISGTNDATVTGNTVIGDTDYQSWIAVTVANSATVTDNISTWYGINNSNITHAGDVITSQMQISDDANFNNWLTTTGATIAPASIASAAAQQALSFVNEIGFVDGPSPTGLTYNFGTVNYYGTSGNDKLTAYQYGSSHLYGYAGDDNLVGGTDGIASVLEGGAGNDGYVIYQPQDIVIEQPNGGNDTVCTYVSYTLPANVETMRAMVAGITLTGGSAAGTLIAAAGGDTLISTATGDFLQGGSGNDVITATGGVKVLGYDGNDLITVSSGTNSLNGGNGNDTIIGGSGNDTIIGGPGADVLTGGGGANEYQYFTGDFAGGLAGSEDTITDFNPAAGDKLNLFALDANTNTSVNDAFKFIGNQPFHSVAGELNYAADGDGITVYGDTNGDGVADFAIHLSGLSSITASNIVL